MANSSSFASVREICNASDGGRIVKECVYIKLWWTWIFTRGHISDRANPYKASSNAAKTETQQSDCNTMQTLRFGSFVKSGNLKYSFLLL